MKKINIVQAEGTINILVDGGYNPTKSLFHMEKLPNLIFYSKESQLV